MAPMQTLLLLLLLFAVSSYAYALTTSPPSPMVTSACARARYPALCLRTLASASPRNPTDIAIASVAASLSSARSAAAQLRSIPSPLPGPLRDCLQQLSDSADQLEKTKAELNRRIKTRPAYSRMQLDNVCTWVSAALTNEDTCLDAAKRLDGGSVRDMVGAKVRALERVTSNALYFVTHLANYSKNH